MLKGTVRERIWTNMANEKEDKKEIFLGVVKLLLWTGAITMLFAHTLITETTFFFHNLPFILVMFVLFIVSFCGMGSEEIDVRIASKKRELFTEEEFKNIIDLKRGVFALMATMKFILPINIMILTTITNQEFYMYEIGGYAISHWIFTIFIVATMALFAQCLILNARLDEGKENSDLPKVLFVDDLRKEVAKVNRVIEHRNEYFPEEDFAEMKTKIEELNELLSVYKNADMIVRVETRKIAKATIDNVYKTLLRNTAVTEDIEAIERKAKRIMG